MAVTVGIRATGSREHTSSCTEPKSRHTYEHTIQKSLPPPPLPRLRFLIGKWFYGGESGDGEMVAWTGVCATCGKTQE